MQKLQHEHLAVACQAFHLVSFLLWNYLRAPVQWEEIHFKEVFLSGNATRKSIELTLLPICFIVLKISVPWFSLGFDENELSFNLGKRILLVHHRIMEPKENIAAQHEQICRKIISGFGSFPISAIG
jgi:hypothetical protein